MGRNLTIVQDIVKKMKTVVVLVLARRLPQRQYPLPMPSRYSQEGRQGLYPGLNHHPEKTLMLCWFLMKITRLVLNFLRWKRQ